MSQLRGKVVLVDFWTYSCINCQRALPHIEAWYRDYAKDGLVVVGVHTPEFAFRARRLQRPDRGGCVRRAVPSRHRRQLRHLEFLRQRVLAS
jgi:thiol-disulfide isomerase/thioredoxin